MAITLNIEPPDLALAKNKVVFVAETDNYISAAGTKSKVILQVSGTPVLEETIRFEWVDNDVTLTISSIPDDSGTEVRQRTGGDTDATYATKLVEDFNTNYYLYRDFVIAVNSGDNTKIDIEARATGEKYTLTVTNGLTDISTDSNTAGVDTAYRDNFKIAADLYVENIETSAYEKVASEYSPDSDSTVVMDFSENLKHVFTSIDEIDLEMGSTLELTPGPIRKYYIKYAERFGSPSVYQKAYESEIRRVLSGGLKKAQGFYNYNIGTYIADNKKILSWLPTTRYVTLNQFELLNFLCYDDSSTVGNISIDVQLFYDDDTLGFYTFDADETDKDQYNIYRVPAGNLQLELSAIDPDKTIEKYIFRLKNDSDTISEEITFKIVPEEVESNYFIYQNSFGVLETIHFTGETEQGVEVEKQEYMKFLQYDYSAFDAELLTDIPTYQETFTSNTGFKTKAEIQVLAREFLNSRSHWIIKDEQVIPVKIITKSVKFLKDSDDVYAFSFEYRNAFVEHSYSVL